MAAEEFIELRIYKIHHGLRDRFAESMRLEVLPRFRDQGITIIHYGPSAHDKDSYYLIRAYPSVADRLEKLNAVFGDPDWLANHESYIMDMIDVISTAMFSADEELIEMLKERFAGEAAGETVSVKATRSD